MPSIPQRAVPKIEHLQPRSMLERLNWEDLKVFLAAADAQSFRDTSRKLRISCSTVTRRIERLEAALSIELFHRLPEGIFLTQYGQTVAQFARTMQQSLCDIGRNRSTLELTASGEVTIAVTEGLGSYWVMPRLVEFQRENPRTAINLFCAMDSVDVLRLEADLAIQFKRPEQPEVIIIKLGKLHVYPFAAPAYVSTYGMPENIGDMPNHRLVEQIAPQLDSSALARYFGLPQDSPAIAVRTNTSTAHLYAIEKGAGIGVLPTFALALGAPVVPVDIGNGYSLDIWLTYHRDARKCRHKSQAISWLRAMFDASQFPWFKDQFIHPNKLVSHAQQRARPNIASNSLAASPTISPLRRNSLNAKR